MDRGESQDIIKRLGPLDEQPHEKLNNTIRELFDHSLYLFPNIRDDK
jgi:hypothetical protein